METYIFVYFGSLLSALIITPAVIMIANKIKAVDYPGVRAVHTRPVPRIGGLVIFLSTMTFIVIVLFVNNSIGRAFQSSKTQLITLLCSAAFIFLIGLIDDLKGLSARIKLISELLAVVVLCIAGIKISSIYITKEWVINLGILSCPLTILWIVGITNAVNLSDGLDGLAAGISAIACGVIAIFSVYSGNVIMAIIMLAMLGSLSGFLFFNFNPAKIFMGDCGSLFLGFTIASASVQCSTKSSALVGLALPFLALGIPIFDTLFSMLRRSIERRSIFSPDRRHFHHMLIDMGIKQRHVVISIYVMTFLFTGLGMFMMITNNRNTFLIFICVITLIIILFSVVGSIRLKETLAGLQKKYEIANRCKQEKMKFDYAQLYFRKAHTYDQWWTAVCKAAEQLDFAWLSMKSETLDGIIQTEVWRMPDFKANFSKLIIMTIPFDHNGDKKSCEFEVAISVNGSLESAGNRATLFNRLIDESAVYNLSSSTTQVSKQKNNLPEDICYR
ncbi:MAG: undecaprenyl/decaprenyl-phosphate alpha-N-acetylglucosaminyl 1-phosphate transferase [Sedimentisphaerales bacterium]|nr:undecaprenyl/decaprenyl-phosphate alpha-N-acetylglucosaminyl 1-phosphate transferase [Sedimentisphaerales bacterium]